MATLRERLETLREKFEVWKLKKGAIAQRKRWELRREQRELTGQSLRVRKQTKKRHPHFCGAFGKNRRLLPCPPLSPCAMRKKYKKEKAT